MVRDTADTIVAVSSPPGRSYRGLTRISGPEALPIARSLLVDARLLVESPRILTACRLTVPLGSSHTPSIPCYAAFFPGPGSYTVQDIVEVQIPGNAALLDRLVHQAVNQGARLAEPGEFTFRAFIAGRLDLTQAEGVAATVSAISDAQLTAASLLRQGHLAAHTRQLVDDLGDALALVEAGIDFVDQEDVVPIPALQLKQVLNRIYAALKQLLTRCRSWGTIDALPRVVLVGPPSSGKSTMFNCLLGRQRAVIDCMPGTTRDALAEPLTLPQRDGSVAEVMLVDIAGLDTPEAMLGRAAQQAAQREWQAADVLVSFGQMPHDAPDVPVIHVQSKADLLPPDPDRLPISGTTGQGIDELKRRMADALGSQGAAGHTESLVLQPRHEAALRTAEAHIADAVRLLSAPPRSDIVPDVELVAGSMRLALDALAGLGGQLTPDDVIGKVFKTFCVGK